MMHGMSAFKTLIVEDNAAFRRSLSELLRASYPTMVVAQADNISDAWKKIVEIEPRLAFVDIRLGEENGLDLTRDIVQFYPRVMVAVITGYNIPEYRQAAFQNGAHFFIPKESAGSSVILTLVDSIRSGRPPQWALGGGSINPANRIPPWKK